MSDLPFSSQITIGVASLVILGSLTYLIVRWFQNTEHPWRAIATTCRKRLPLAAPVLQLLGTGYLIMAVGLFLFCELAADQIPTAERIQLLRLAWGTFEGGGVYVLAALACRRLLPPPTVARGSVWAVDMGLTARIRPCLVLSAPADPKSRAPVTVVPHSTRGRGARFEVDAPTSFLKPGAFDAQQVETVARARLIRHLGDLDATELTQVEDAVRKWLGL